MPSSPIPIGRLKESRSSRRILLRSKSKFLPAGVGAPRERGAVGGRANVQDLQAVGMPLPGPARVGPIPVGGGMDPNVAASRALQLRESRAAGGGFSPGERRRVLANKAQRERAASDVVRQDARVAQEKAQAKAAEVALQAQRDFELKKAGVAPGIAAKAAVNVQELKGKQAATELNMQIQADIADRMARGEDFSTPQSLGWQKMRVETDEAIAEKQAAGDIDGANILLQAKVNLIESQYNQTLFERGEGAPSVEPGAQGVGAPAPVPAPPALSQAGAQTLSEFPEDLPGADIPADVQEWYDILKVINPKEMNLEETQAWKWIKEKYLK